MSVAIVGGNECMMRRYKDLCKEYSCKAKVYLKPSTCLKNIGSPDLLVLFTGTMSHKMLYRVLDAAKGQDIQIARSYTGSLSALRKILEDHR